VSEHETPVDGAITSTGLPQVDAVLESLTTLADLPVDEHVAVFEAAHAGLRAALSDAGSGQPVAG
jgi:hypothetical protein